MHGHNLDSAKKNIYYSIMKIGSQGWPMNIFFSFLSSAVFCFSIWRNGHSLGVAFDNVQYGPGLAYFPAASLSYGESCQMNFGAAPFKYPSVWYFESSYCN